MTKHKPHHDDQPLRAEPDRLAAESPPADTIGDNTAATEQANLLEQLRTDLEGAKDRVLRSQAELENYRKRAAREIEEHRRYANLPLLRDLLPVLDNIQRAVAAADKTHDATSLLEGVKMVLQQFDDVLRRYHCTRIAALHQPFNPHLHEALSQQPSQEHPANTVLLEVRPGFELFDRVVRPSQVIVSTSSPSPPPGEGDENSPLPPGEG
jgi:molecular chaperone GrpE